MVGVGEGSGERRGEEEMINVFLVGIWRHWALEGI